MTDENDIQKRLGEQGRRLFEVFLLEKIEMLQALQIEYGPGVLDVAKRHENERTRARWSRVAEQTENHGIEELIQMLCGSGGYEYTAEQRDGGVQLCFTRCPHHDFAKVRGITDLAYHLICAQDPFIVEGFNSKMGFRRSKTLMQGDDCCDHFYYMKD